MSKTSIELPFVKLYLNGGMVSWFKSMSSTEILLLLEMVRIMDYDNIVSWDAGHRKKFCKNNEICLDKGDNVSTASFSNFMAKLCQKNLIFRLKPGLYQVNMDVFSK